MSFEAVEKIKAIKEAQSDSFLAQVRAQVEADAQSLKDRHQTIEEHIAFVGEVLDDLKAARKVLDDALMATEKLRVSFREPEEVRYEPTDKRPY